MRERFKERFGGVQGSNQAGETDHEGLEGVRKELKGVWDVLQREGWERIRFAFEIGSTKIREDFATDLCTPKETQNPKQDPTQDDSRIEALAYKQIYMYATIC